MVTGVSIVVGATVDAGSFLRLYLRTIAFGLTLGLLTAAVFIVLELMWQTFGGNASWSGEAFGIQSVLIYLAIALVAGALYAVIMWFKSDLAHLIIGDAVAGASMGFATYFILLFSTLAYGDTLIHLGFDGAHPAGLSYSAAAFLVPLVIIALIGAIATSAGAITCRAVIRKKRPSDKDMRNAALGAIGMIALIVVAPPLAALALSGF